jgi:hypothetical protein
MKFDTHQLAENQLWLIEIPAEFTTVTRELTIHYVKSRTVKFIEIDRVFFINDVVFLKRIN